MNHKNSLSAKTLHSELLKSNGFLIATLGAESRRRFIQATSQWDISWHHQNTLTALLGLSKHGFVSQRDVADFIGIDPRNAVAIIDNLEERALIERTPDPEDRRRHNLQLTPDGAALARKIQAASQELEAAMFNCLMTEEQETLHKLLLKLHSNIEGES